MRLILNCLITPSSAFSQEIRVNWGDYFLELEETSPMTLSISIEGIKY